MEVAGAILAVIGCIGCLVGQVMLLTVAYKRGLGWFFGCMFFPPLWLALLALHFAAAMKPIAIIVAGIGLAWLGVFMAGMEF